ncbi:MAG: hypothetical protein AAGB19_10005, partial [Cyanobacteria bacterium P01_F01_bin.3]
MLKSTVLSVVNSKPIKFFSLLAGLLLAAYGTSAKAEVNVENLSSSNRSDQQSTVVTAESIVAEPLLLHTDPTDETTTLQSINQAVDLSGATSNSTEALETLSDATSTDNAYARLRSLLQREESTEAVISPTEEFPSQSEDYAITDEARTGLDSTPSAPFSSDVFSDMPLFDTPLLVGDGGAPHF